MPEHTKLIGQLAVLFLVTTILLLLMDRQMLIGPEDLKQWPFALLSFLLMIGLFLIVAYLVHSQVSRSETARNNLERRLTETERELSATREDLEQRVERRTFEISVANASLNREIAERIQAETETAE